VADRKSLLVETFLKKVGSIDVQLFDLRPLCGPLKVSGLFTKRVSVKNNISAKPAEA